MMPRALWLPYAVADLDAATRFYTEQLDLAPVDGWDRPGERGVVLRAADAAYVELVSGPALGGPVGGGDPAALLAFELTDRAAVNAAHVRAGRPPAPRVFPRGHRGFPLAGPAGARLLIWSES
ncbi:MAG TPA: VOC family protein [Micromonosporaceae bacterium]|nr:VOC family protein [Micromonosporaceae bacterium]